MDRHEWQRIIEQTLAQLSADYYLNRRPYYTSSLCVPTNKRLETERLKDEFWLRELGIAP